MNKLNEPMKTHWFKGQGIEKGQGWNLHKTNYYNIIMQNEMNSYKKKQLKEFKLEHQIIYKYYFFFSYL